jgi:hypothetical protein
MSTSKLIPVNEHWAERVLRVLVGIVVLSLLFVGPRSPWALLGLVLLATGLLGSCPIYTLFGVSTRRKHAHREAGLKT